MDQRSVQKMQITRKFTIFNQLVNYAQSLGKKIWKEITRNVLPGDQHE